ncbi:hypothetical protein KY290_014779 [Solanum tuberosum]|uniref:Ty3 transposon capsid-like protein domain-containing protein n=1 Tax=Solanum tuberosum TaxID=4113 RepID=A0ABQ7VQU3_SOLTU|nr:hypothetical protein KY284_014184 [Solanum tuberosum]KAH0770798.1 hypothetical protein KY290_014779 [Solanum tuberosum]
MVKGTRSNGDPSNEAVETVELRDMMQQLLTQVNTLTGKVSSLEKLDQAMIDLRNQLKLMESEGNNQKKGVPAEEKVGVTALQLESEVIQWHLSFMRFGTDFNDPIEEIKNVKQMGNVKEYQVEFERNLTRVNLSQENAISCFIGGLKHELNIDVNVTNPTTLAQVYKSAKLQEAYIAAVRQPAQTNSQVNSRRFTGHRNYNSKPILLTPGFGGSSGSRGMNRRTLSAEEMNEKRSKGLYYFCNEKYFLDTSGLNILIDIGSSHNFIEPELVGQLGCEIMSTSPQLVAAANGNMRVDKMTIVTWLLQGAKFTADFLLLPLGCCGVVLGVQWLLTLGDIKMNFRNLTMEFWYKGRKHLLRGVVLMQGGHPIAFISKALSPRHAALSV